MALRARIDDFLSRKRLALVGVSRNPQDFTRSMFREFRRRGYDVVPVNPNVRRRGPALLRPRSGDHTAR